MLYDFLVVKQITPTNPAHSVRGPKCVVKKGKTPRLEAAKMAKRYWIQFPRIRCPAYSLPAIDPAPKLPSAMARRARLLSPV
jgi:hypothetical protein